MSIGIFTLALAANESREVAITGEYFELRNALQAIPLIELLDKHGGVIARLDNPEQSDFVRPGRYETVRITNGPVAQTVKHFYGSGDAGSRRTSGLVRIDGTSEVSVVDGGRLRTTANTAFSAVAYCAPAVGGYAHVQLWNPVGSGKSLAVSQIILASSALGAISLLAHNASYGTQTGMASSKLIGGAASVAQARTISNGVVIPVGASLGNLSTDTTPIYKLAEPIVIPPGQSLSAVVTSVTNTSLTAVFEFIEF